METDHRSPQVRHPLCLACFLCCLCEHILANKHIPIPFLLVLSRVLVRPLDKWTRGSSSSFLSHVPDNQQLVLHLLRGREYAHSPLMLPPTLEEEEKAEQEYIDDVAEVRAPFNVSDLRKIEEAEKNQGPTSPDQGRLATFLHRRHRANKDVLKHRFRDIAGLQSKDEEPKLVSCVLITLVNEV